MAVNILTMKWGTLYGPHYVNRLYWSVERNLNRKFRFVCFTDNPSGIIPEVECFPMIDVKVPGSVKDLRWPKLGVFRKDIANLEGTCLFLDLDVLVVDSLDCIFDYKPGSFSISHTWWTPFKHWKANLQNRLKEGNTSVFRFEANALEFIVDEFESNAVEIAEKYFSEQLYVTQRLINQLEWFPEPWIRSFRRHCRPTIPLNTILQPKIPKEAKIIAFHGRPKMDEAAVGFASDRPFRGCRPTPWIYKHWKNKDNVPVEHESRK